MKRTALLALITGILSLGSTTWGEESARLTLESIECSGNENTHCELLERELHLSPGQLIDEAEIENTRIRIGLLGLFKQVRLSLKKGSERGKAILKIEVEEDSPYYTEFATGMILEEPQLSQVLSGTIGNRNFLGRGKILQARVRAQTNLNRDPFTNGVLQAEYVDPHLLGSKNYFLNAGAFLFHNSRAVFVNPDGSPKGAAQTFFGPMAALGRRVFDYSYIRIGYRYNSNLLSEIKEYPFLAFRNQLSLSYGWNSEDDSNFPTQGSRFAFDVFAGDTPRMSYVGTLGFFLPSFQKHFAINENHILSLSLMNYPLVQQGWFFVGPDEFISLGLKYSHQLRRNASSAAIRNARVTIEGGLDSFGATSKAWVLEPGVKLGLTLDVPSVGLLNFYLMYEAFKSGGLGGADQG